MTAIASSNPVLSPERVSSKAGALYGLSDFAHDLAEGSPVDVRSEADHALHVVAVHLAQRCPVLHLGHIRDQGSRETVIRGAVVHNGQIPHVVQ